MNNNSEKPIKIFSKNETKSSVPIVSFFKKLLTYEPENEYFFSIPEESTENEPNITYENQQP